METAAKAFLRLAPVPPARADAHVGGVGLFPQDGVGRSGMGGLSPSGAAALEGGVGRDGGRCGWAGRPFGTRDWSGGKGEE